MNDGLSTLFRLVMSVSSVVLLSATFPYCAEQPGLEEVDCYQGGCCFFITLKSWLGNKAQAPYLRNHRSHRIREFNPQERQERLVPSSRLILLQLGPSTTAMWDVKMSLLLENLRGTEL